MLEKVEVQSLIKTIDKNNGIKRALEKLSIKSEEDFFKYTIYKAENEWYCVLFCTFLHCFCGLYGQNSTRWNR